MEFCHFPSSTHTVELLGSLHNNRYGELLNASSSLYICINLEDKLLVKWPVASLPQPQMCVAMGPGGDMFQSTKIIGQRQFSMGKVWSQIT